MRILLVYPCHPRTTYWSFSQIMELIGRRATMPPLGLITVAAMIPEPHEMRLVDMNIEALADSDLLWADVVFTSSMDIQAPSLREVVARSHALGVPVVAGGPHPTVHHAELAEIEHLVIGEAEGLMAELLEDLASGRARHIYECQELPSLREPLVPRFDLLELGAYNSMAVQQSRGCPFNCEFCDIWRLYGRRPRVKEPAHFLAECDALHELGWDGTVFVVDDNFIGNPRQVKGLLAPLAEWQQAKGFPFQFITEASLNLASDPSLLACMRDAGFGMVFLGIETPAEEGLRETGKHHNLRVDLLESVATIQAHGIEVSAGFIVGFDSDTEDIFARMSRFIDDAGIPMAMVGLLTALRSTDLYERLEREGRLHAESSGNNTHLLETNFATRLDRETLATGYLSVLTTIYDRRLKNYFIRCRSLLERLGENPRYSRPVTREGILLLLRTLRLVPFRPFGFEYSKFLLWAIVHHRHRFTEAVRLGLMGFHFHAITHGARGLPALGRGAS